MSRTTKNYKPRKNKPCKEENGKGIVYSTNNSKLKQKNKNVKTTD